MLKDKLPSIVLTLTLFATIAVAEVAEDTEIVFKINWPGKSSPEIVESKIKAEPYVITTANNEKYQCLIPDTTRQEKEHTGKFQSVDPMEYLQPLFAQNTCTYKLEAYWAYEVCHGRYVRQFHEEREGKKSKIQEYYLGIFDKDKHKAGQTEKWFAEEMMQLGPPVKKVDGIEMPYVEVVMTDGTVCDLNNKPRTIKLLYICFEHGNHDIMSLEETSSCEYEAIVLSPLICGHPDYKARGMGENEINCTPLDGAPKVPRSLLALEAESFKFRHQKLTDEKPHKLRAIVFIDKDSQDGETRARAEIRPIDVLDKHNVDNSDNSLLEQGAGQSELSPVRSFLSGKNCLNGGNGWWKYEFCYGRSVVQYHTERDGTKTTVNLGRFDKKKHIEWMEKHPNRRPSLPANKKQLWHFYSDGSTCEKTGQLRQTEVRLMCVESPTSPSSVSLTLLEPKVCEYILVVESPLICDILEYADANGLVSKDAILIFGESKSPIERPTTKSDGDLDLRIANDDE